jgi:hypothetical protein
MGDGRSIKIRLPKKNRLTDYIDIPLVQQLLEAAQRHWQPVTSFD